MKHVKKLRFEDRPDYTYLKRLFKDLFWKNFEEWDLLYDWVEKNSEENQKAILTE